MIVNLKTSFCISFAILLFASCTMEKRQHSFGYHIEWNGHDHAKKHNINSEINDNSVVLIQEFNSNDITLSASTSNEIYFENEALIKPIFKIEKSKSLIHNKNTKQNEPCDIITFKDGSEKEVKVIEVSTSEIKYKRCNDSNSPIYSVSKDKVFSLKYPNGEKDLFNNYKAQSETSSEGKSQLIALLLCIFLGGFGIHRFYLGHPVMGVIYLLTAGLCGVGWLIDIILILTGDLKPKDGDYDSKL
jgi:TM2 domain-containing membrane protein YozV